MGQLLPTTPKESKQRQRHHLMLIFTIFVLYPQTSMYRDTSIAHKGVTLRNFASNFQNNQKILIDFQGLERFMEDKVNFVSVMGCELYNNKASLIQISDEPLIIINGISYFLLTSESCNLDVLKYIYTLCESVYVSQKLLPDLEYGFDKIIDASQTWDINNNLYVVSKHMNQSDSQMRTSTSTKQFYQYFDRLSESRKKSQKKAFSIKVFQKYFTQIYIVNQASISFSDPSIIKEHLQEKYDPDVSRWFTYQSLLKSCTKFYSSLQKIFSLKQFHQTNNQQIIQTLGQKVLNNYNLFALQVLKTNAKANCNQQNFNKQNQKQRNPFQQKQIEWQNQKQRIKKIKKIIMEPLTEVQNCWLGRSNQYPDHLLKTKQKVEEQLQRIMRNSITKNQKGVFQQIDEMIEDEDQNSFQIIGHGKFDNARINFTNYVNKIKSSLSIMLKNNVLSKKWRSKKQPVRSNRDMLYNLETRIDINERKKQGLQQAIKLAIKQNQYLNDLVFDKKKTKEDKR